MKIINPYLRSDVYRLLSECYLYPDNEKQTEIKHQSERVKDILENLARHTGYISTETAAGFMSALDSPTLEDCQVEYVRLFDYRPKCGIYESAYVKTEGENPAKLQLQIEECYSRFGLGTSEGFSDPPDHLSIELEFMHFLTNQEAEAMDQGHEEEMEICLQAQREFSTNHLNNWVPGFCDCLATHAQLEFYRILATITRNFVSEDLTYLDGLFQE